MHLTRAARRTSITVLAALAILGTVVSAPPVNAAPPSNDDFDSPIEVGAVPFTSTIDTSEATTAPDDPSCFGDGFTAWYGFTAPSDQRFEIDTFGSDYDTTLAAFTGSRGSLTSLACNDDAEGRQSRIRIDLTSGERVFLMAASFVGEPGGSLVLNVGVGLPPPAGDDFDSAVPVGSIPFSTTMDLTEATVANDDPSCGGGDDTVWLVYTADEETRIRASLDEEGGFGNAISAYTGVRGSLEQIGCHGTEAPAGDADDARITIVAAANETVYFMVSASGSVVVHLDVAEPPPANDQIDNAIVITSLPFEDSPEASGASVEPGDPVVSAPCELEAPLEQTLWYSFTSADEIALRARARDPGFSPDAVVLAVFSGESAPRDQLGCAIEDDSFELIPAIVGVHVPAGQRIWFMVGLANSATGEFTLRVEIAPPPPANDDFDNALSIESLPFETSLDMFSATSAPDDPVASCGLGVLPTTWFAFEAVDRTRVEFEVVSGGVGPAIAAYTGTRGHLNEVACSGENAPGVAVTIESGMTVYFLVQCCPPDLELFVNAFEVPPPPNDDIRSATLISQSDLPYELFPFVDVGLSTSAPSDPRCLGQGGSVWYRFRPGFDMWAEVATHFPDADYVLAVVAVSPRGIRLLGCADDTVPPPPELPDQRASERMRFWAKAGVSYLIGVGTPDSPNTLDLTLTEVVPVVVDPIGLLLPNGDALVKGTLRCSHPMEGTLDIFGVQGSDESQIFGSAFEDKPCRGGFERWTVVVSPEPDRFHRGRLSLGLTWDFVEDPDLGTYARTSLEKEIFLVRSRGTDSGGT